MSNPSPLYTSAQAEKLKRQIISDLGKDVDGAYRAYNRKDGKGGKRPVDAVKKVTMAEEVLAAEEVAV